jgi:hypothetical protein
VAFAESTGVYDRSIIVAGNTFANNTCPVGGGASTMMTSPSSSSCCSQEI